MPELNEKKLTSLSVVLDDESEEIVKTLRTKYCVNTSELIRGYLKEVIKVYETSKLPTIAQD